jgi:hypothetical protein
VWPGGIPGRRSLGPSVWAQAGKSDGASQFITSKDVIPYTPLVAEGGSERESSPDLVVAEMSRAAAEAAATSAGLTERVADKIDREAVRTAQMAEPKKQQASRQFIKVFP